MGKTGERANAESSVFIHGHPPNLVQGLNGDQLHTGPFYLPHLNQHVGASGDDLGLGVGKAQGHGILHGFGLVQGFHVIHTLALLYSSINPASFNFR